MMGEQLWKQTVAEPDGALLYPEPVPDGGWPVWSLFWDADRGGVYDEVNLTRVGGTAGLSHQGFWVVPFGSAFVVLETDGGVGEPVAVASTLPGAVAIVDGLAAEKKAAGFRLADGEWMPPVSSADDMKAKEAR